MKRDCWSAIASPAPDSSPVYTVPGLFIGLIQTGHWHILLYSRLRAPRGCWDSGILSSVFI
jgi:hypothetical protein